MPTTPAHSSLICPGLVSITFRALSPAAIIDLVAASGLASIEWGGDVHVPHGDDARAAAVGAQTRAAGLTVAAYGSYYRVGQSEGAGLSFAAVLASAVALGAPLIRVWAGTTAPAQTDAAQRATIVADARRIADLAAAAHRQVAFEFHGGTLTETTASAQALLQAVAHPHCVTLWQPPNGQPDEVCTASLQAMLPAVANVHVFHWGPGGFRDRLPLAAGAARWRPWLRRLAATGRPHHALLEFVSADDPARFRADAQTLQEWVAELAAP